MQYTIQYIFPLKNVKKEQEDGSEGKAFAADLSVNLQNLP